MARAMIAMFVGKIPGLPRRLGARGVHALLDEPLLIFRRQQRENRRDLIVEADDPLRRLAELLRHDGFFAGAHQPDRGGDRAVLR